ncbi:nif-specific transcriptional activator NifA [Caenispirillum salinarum]|uniref:nif-specific transcriptional activator NifA n=1 Tax=Caenispirillum salinarum TaxID=859058 RepID=UPI00384D4BD5
MKHSATGGDALSLISIYEISKILGSSLDLEKTLHDVLNLLSSYLQMRRGVVALGGEGGKDIRILAASGLSRRAVMDGQCGFPPAVIDRVIGSGVPMVVGNAVTDPAFEDYLSHADAEAGDVISVIAVPIKINGESAGLLSIEREWESDLQFKFETDVRFLTMVANLIGQTVRLHHSVANDRDRLMREKVALEKRLREDLQGVDGEDLAIGDSKAMRRVFAEIAQVAPTKSTVLLRGESGTGKELIARAVHTLSPRVDKPFIKVNCAALPETLLESELFGHEKGAFTGATQDRKGRFEQAAGGTLFLDEIGEISASFQAKLLRVLQEGEFERVGGNKTLHVDFRLVCATNKNLEAAVAAGEFRADLYYRINVVPVFLPPLRDRKEDIPALVDHFLARFNEENGRSLDIAPEAMGVFQHCHFPGNVRELENCVNRVATMTRGDVIEDVDLPCQRDQCLSSVLWQERADAAGMPVGGMAPMETRRQRVPLSAVSGGRPTSAGEAPMRRSSPAAAVPPVVPAEPSPDDHLLDDDYEDGGGLTPRERLVAAMEKSGWVQAKAARMLGLTPRQIGYALKKYNIEVKRL